MLQARLLLQRHEQVEDHIGDGGLHAAGEISFLLDRELRLLGRETDLIKKEWRGHKVPALRQK